LAFVLTIYRNYLLLVDSYRLRVSRRWRVTFLQQLKKVTKKSRHYNCAPIKTGVPIESMQSSCCEKTRRRRSDSFHRKLMITAPPQWLVEVGESQKKKTVLISTFALQK